MKYTIRKNAFGKEISFEANEFELIIIDSDENIQKISYAEIKKVTLQFTPMKYRKNTFRCIIEPKAGKVVKLSNQHYVGIADFEDRSVMYSNFLLEFHKLLINKNPDVIFQKGMNKLGYLAAMGIMIIGTLYFGAFGIYSLLEGNWFYSILFVLSCFGLGLTTFSYGKLNKWGIYNPLNIPVGLLPS